MMIISDEILLVVLIATFVASLVYAVEHRDYVIGVGWTTPLAGLICYYLLLVLQIPGFYDNVPLRQAIVRPSLVGFFVMALIHILNGKVNRIITKVTQGISSWTHKLYKTLSP